MRIEVSEKRERGEYECVVRQFTVYQSPSKIASCVHAKTAELWSTKTLCCVMETESINITVNIERGLGIKCYKNNLLCGVL